MDDVLIAWGGVAAQFVVLVIRKLEAGSERIAADIIDKLKKGKSDA